MVWGGRWEGGSGWGTRVHPWQMHVDVWQNQYNIVKLKKKKESGLFYFCLFSIFVCPIALSGFQNSPLTKARRNPELARLLFESQDP